MRLPSTSNIGLVVSILSVDGLSGGTYKNDIATLLHYHQPGVTVLLVKLSKYVNENDLTEIQRIVTDIQNRLNRSKNESR